MRAAVRAARSGASADFVTLAEVPQAVPTATQLAVGPVQRNALASSLGPTSSEPRIALGKMGFVAGVAMAVAVGSVALFFVSGHRSAPGSAAATQPNAEPAAPTATAPAAPAQPAPPTVTVGLSAQPSSTASAAPEPPAPSATAAAHVPHPKPAAPKAPAAPKIDPLKNW